MTDGPRPQTLETFDAKWAPSESGPRHDFWWDLVALLLAERVRAKREALAQFRETFDRLAASVDKEEAR